MPPHAHIVIVPSKLAASGSQFNDKERCNICHAQQSDFEQTGNSFCIQEITSVNNILHASDDNPEEGGSILHFFSCSSAHVFATHNDMSRGLLVTELAIKQNQGTTRP
jgi:hypothetical protein